MNPAFHFSHVDHVTLVVSDLEATRRFYCDGLGMVQVPRPDFDYAGIWLHTHAAEPGEIVRALIHATLAGDDAGRAGWGEQGVGRLTRGHHFAFQVDDVLGMHKMLQEKQVDIVSHPKPRPDGPTQIFVKDPDGHLLEFFSLPPDASKRQK